MTLDLRANPTTDRRMPKSNATWKVQPHGPLEKFGENLWRIEGSLEGMALKRVMTLARLDDGGLVIHNAIPLEEELMKEIESFGSPTYLVVPNGYHRLDAPVFKQRYPNAKVICPTGATEKVGEVIGVDLTYADFQKNGRVTFEELDGTKAAEGVMIVHDEEGTSLVFNDAIFNMPHGSGIAGFVFRHITASTGGPRVSRLLKWLVLKDKSAFVAHLNRLAKTPNLKRIIVSHHEVIDQDPAGVLSRVAAEV